MRPVVVLTDLGSRGAEAIAVADRWTDEDPPLLVALQLPRPDPIAPLLPHRVSPVGEADLSLSPTP